MQYLKENDHSAALLYMESILAKGNTLAKFLLQSVKAQEGTVLILSPDVLGSSQVLQFDSGHFPQETVPGTVGGLPGSISAVADSDEDFVRLIYEQFETPDSVCVMENLIASHGDPWLQRAKSCVVSHGSEIFHVVFNEDHTEDKIDDAISDARRIPVFIGAVGRLTTETTHSIQRQKAITTSDLQSIAQTAWVIFVGAYDGEGFVIWKRRPR
jgi:hypothetical protein